MEAPTHHQPTLLRFWKIEKDETATTALRNKFKSSVVTVDKSDGTKAKQKIAKEKEVEEKDKKFRTKSRRGLKTRTNT
jgi:transposase-like protein